MIKYNFQSLFSYLFVRISAAAIIISAFVIAIILFSMASLIVILDVIAIYDYFFYWIVNPTAGDVIRLNILIFFTFLITESYPSQQTINNNKEIFNTDNSYYALLMNFLFLLFTFSPIVFISAFVASILEYSTLDINSVVAPLIPIVSWLVMSLIFMVKTSSRSEKTNFNNSEVSV